MKQFNFCVCLFAITLSAGCGGIEQATLFVDNDSKEAVRVSIDGQRDLYVGPKKFAKRRITFGEHRVVVTRKGKVVFDEVKNFEPHADGPSWRHFLLDPDADTKYAVKEVYYYENQEKANSSKASRRLYGLKKQHWVKVPKGACALSPMLLVFTSGDKEKTKRLCVTKDKVDTNKRRRR